MNSFQKKLHTIIREFPNKPGVYRFLNKEEKVIYVGKAKNLKKRVQTYFSHKKHASLRTEILVSQIADIQYTVVESELEALLLEIHFIKEFQPKWNVVMKDDKNYAYIKITINEDFPRISIVRRIENDSARYFGPKTSASKARETLDLLKRLFAYRHCDLNIKFAPFSVENKTIKYPCLDYHIKRCIGPCTGKITPEAYQKIIKNIINFLEGRERSIIHELKSDMQKAVSEKKFELAALLRDKILLLEGMTERQRISDPELTNQDIIHFVAHGGEISFNLFVIRSGKLINQENFVFQTREMSPSTQLRVNSAQSDEEIISAFLKQYYEKTADIPEEIIVPSEPSDKDVIAAWLSKKRKTHVKIIVPKKGKKRSLLDLAEKNAEHFSKQNEIKFLNDEKRTRGACQELSDILGLPETLRRIEGYDISHTSGTEIVGSMVVFENGLPKKSDYRRFRIKIAPGKSDDYLDLKEILGRRLRKFAKNGNQSILHDAVFRKGRKADMKNIEKILMDSKLDAEALTPRDFLIAEKDKTTVGFGRIKKVNIGTRKKPKIVGEMASLWVDPSFRGHHMGQEIAVRLLKKTKHKKVYIVNSAALADYYGALGFHEVPDEKIPPIFRRKMKLCDCSYGHPRMVMTYRPIKEKKDASFQAKPDLLLIDGGKGQLGVVIKILKKYGLKIPVLSLAKREEEVFIPQKETPLDLSKSPYALQLLKRVRDEAHRFAHDYHENLREKKMLLS